jgi:histidinol dehydrogenase
VGPGNVLAATAKKEVYGIVDIDYCRSSEIQEPADSSANRIGRRRLLSQAEHGYGFEAAIISPITWKTAKLIETCVHIQVENSPETRTS